MMKGYDENGNILLPPRLPGEELPPELLSFYQEHRAHFIEGEDGKPQETEESTRTEGSFLILL